MKTAGKRIALALVTIVCIMIAVPVVSNAGESTGYVEVRVLFDEYQKTKDVDARISDLAAKKQKDRDGLVETIRRMKDEMVVLADKGDEKVKKEAEIDAKIKELQAFDEAARDELTKMRDEKVREIFEDINTTISNFGAKKGYDFIFVDTSLAYKKDKFNVTSGVLKELNKSYQK